MKVSALLALTVVVFLVSNLAGSVEFSGNIGNETVNKTISVEKVYFPGDKVILKANFMPLKAKLVDPAGKVIGLEFRKSEGGFEAELELKKDVVLGKYLLFADNVSAEFYVDSYSIEAAYFNGKVVGNVSYYFAEPEYVYYKAGKEEGKAKVAEDGSFEILLKKAAKEVELRCGNAVERVKLKAELSIVLDRVEVVNETAFVEGRVLLNGVETEANLSYWFDEEEERVLEVNGTFNLSFSNVSGILHLIAENNGLRAEESVEIEAIKKVVEVGGVYFAGDTVEVVTNFKPKKGLIVGPDGKKEELEFVEEDGKYLARYELKKDVVLGNYTVLVDGIVKQFVVDFCEVSAEFGDGAIWGEARSFYTTPKVRYLIAGENFSEEGVAGGNFNIPVNRTGDFRAVFECGNSRYEMNFSVAEARNVEVDDFSFLGEIVEVRATFMPEEAYIVTPSNETVRLNFSEREGAFIAEIGAEEVGRYNLRVDEFNLSFVVDDYSINASFNGSAVVGMVKWHFVEPEKVCYEAEDFEGCVGVENGKFSLEVPGNVTSVKLKCGNAELTLTIAKSKEIEVNDSYFVGDVVVVKANFEPEESYLVFNNETMEIVFEERNGSWVYEFKAERAGVYRVIADGVERSFVVDSCEIEAKIDGGKVLGEVKTNFTEIFSIKYTLEPLNQSGFVSVENGKFEMEVPENVSEVVLFCGNSALRLKNEAMSDFRVVEFDGLAVNITIDRGRFERLDVEGDEVNLTISGLSAGEKVDVEVSLPFEIPEGMHIYYWKEVDGRIIPVNYTISTDRKTITFSLQDGVVDEDGKANGVIVDPLKFYIPRFKVERELSGKSGVLHVFDLNGEKLYDVKVEVDRGNLSYLAFVDSDNLPSKPTQLPYQLVKFRVDGLSDGDEVTVKITYPSLEGVVTDNGAKYYKFNPYTLNWSEFYAGVENNAVVLKLKDGGFGDDDGKANGVLEDDGGVGWAGYSGRWSASVGMDYQSYQGTHTYWVYVPSGDNFTVCVYDGDGFTVRVYSPSGMETLNEAANSNGGWDNFTINTNRQFGWYKLEIYEPDAVQHGSGYEGNNYELIVRGVDSINLRVNESYDVNGENFHGTVDAITIDVNNNLVPQTQTYYIVGDKFKLAIYDPDRVRRSAAVKVSLYYPNETLYNSWNLPRRNNNWWTSNDISGPYGVWKVVINAIRDYDDYDDYGNYLRLAVNISEGLYFKPPELLNINGKILHDLYPLGRNGGEDKAIRGVEVLLLEDINKNAAPDSGDRVLRRATTDVDGNFSFKAVKDITRKYFVVVNSKSIDAANAGLSYNSGFDFSYIWSEETYQSNESNYGEVITFFGGRSAERSDNVGVSGNNFAGWAEHYVTINKIYNSETLYFGFNYSTIVNTKDSDDDTANPRFCQGCLRQFIANSNAIAGKQRSYFVMAVEPNNKVSDSKWWSITVNSTLGSLPNFNDEVELNGTVLNADMTVNNFNPDCLLYNYSTNTLESVACSKSIPVGVGSDGVPFSGDEPRLNAIPKPEIEIDGNGVADILNVTADNTLISNLALINSSSHGFKIGEAEQNYGNNAFLKNILSGLRADGSDSLRNSGMGGVIYSNNTTISNSIFAFNGGTGLHFWGGGVKSGYVSNVVAYRNGLSNAFADGIGIEGYMSGGYDQRAKNVTIERCLAARNAAAGIDNWFGDMGLKIYNCTVEYNGIGNEGGEVRETAGIRILANESVVSENLIRENAGAGVVMGRMEAYSIHGVLISRNSIYNNSGIAIDIDTRPNGANTYTGNNVSLNDGILNESEPNFGVDYPVITHAELNGNQLYLEGSAISNSQVEIYLVSYSGSGDNLLGNNISQDGSVLEDYYGEGWIYLGTLNAQADGTFSGTLDVSGINIGNGALITAMTILNGNSSEFGPDYKLFKFISVSAGIVVFREGNNFNATISIHAFENATSLRVYWTLPDNFTLESSSGNFDSYGNTSNIYWWEFNSIDAGETRKIYLTLSTTGDYSLLEAYNIGVDPLQ